MIGSLGTSARRLCLVTLTLLCGACATVPYPYGVEYIDRQLVQDAPDEPQIVRGRPHAVLDASDWIWPGSWLGKLILWDVRVDDHRIGEETEALMRRYLEANELYHVKVRLNAYQVIDEWRRLRQNGSVKAGWRYTFGVVSWLRYAVLPGRFFGGDHYNPYTNTINLYSNIPAVAVHEGGHAKDFAGRRWKGAYAASYVIPFVNLYHEAHATADALGYLHDAESEELQQEAYRILYPAYGSYVGAGLGGFLTPAEAWYAAAIVGGHVVGRVEAARRPQEPEEAEEGGSSPELPSDQTPRIRHGQ